MRTLKPVAGIMLLLAALVLGCDDDDDGNCFFSDCQTHADCPGNWECRGSLFLGNVCAEPGATVCHQDFTSSTSVFDDGEIVGPLIPLEGPETSSPTPPASESQPPATSPPSASVRPTFR